MWRSVESAPAIGWLPRTFTILALLLRSVPSLALSALSCLLMTPKSVLTRGPAPLSQGMTEETGGLRIQLWWV